MRIPESELIINDDGSAFHIHLKPEEIADKTVSFCMSVPTKISIPNSKNSQITPTVMEKQKETIATKTGDSLILKRSLRFKRSMSESPTAAARKPVVTCKSVSHTGKRT